jgi:DNA polymerase-3 subunit epsilon
MGACIGKEPAAEYNQRAGQIVLLSTLQHDNFYIVEQGRSNDEWAVVKCSNGNYFGYGFTDNVVVNGNAAILDNCINPYASNRDTRQIIKTYLNSNPQVKVIPY